ncbi:MAG: aminoacyl-tRNA hydrolase [Defluviitaleaceae bacterium]|nr:aminoacyl-tRNA hydrolase [Defluviitaleaceae bacterium]
MYLIFGLGNPGRKYAKTRHNVGFGVIDKLAHDWDINIKESKFSAFAGEGFYDRQKIILIKPTTYMNRSGEAIRDFLSYYKIPAEEIINHLIVIYDDTALDCGKIRIRKRGSAGGHNGIKDILYQTETEDFIRVRLGIGAKPGRMTLADYVLSDFKKHEQEDIIFGIIKAADAVADIISRGADFAMNKYNIREKKQEQEKVGDTTLET